MRETDRHLQTVLSQEYQKRQSLPILHLHRCKTCGKDRTCGTIDCAFRANDKEQDWECCFCAFPDSPK